MKVNDLIATNKYKVLNEGTHGEEELKQPFCCDLLSLAMTKAQPGDCWVTVMGNINTIAVASLADVSCIICAEGVIPPEAVLEKAKAEGVTVLATEEPVFATALFVMESIKGNA